jgi:hypothetical protein
LDARILYALDRMEHRHGSDWYPMEEVTPAHDPAGSDIERQLGRHRIYRCTRCDEDIRVELPGQNESP